VPRRRRKSECRKENGGWRSSPWRRHRPREENALVRIDTADPVADRPGGFLRRCRRFHHNKIDRGASLQSGMKTSGRRASSGEFGACGAMMSTIWRQITLGGSSIIYEFSDYVLFRPQPLRQALIDHRHFGRIRRITRNHQPAAQKPHAHGFTVAGGDLVAIGVDAAPAAGRRGSEILHLHIVILPNQREPRGYRRRFDARRGSQPIEHFAVEEFSIGRLRISRRRQNRKSTLHELAASPCW
jgi:hypothetical protein